MLRNLPGSRRVYERKKFNGLQYSSGNLLKGTMSWAGHAAPVNVNMYVRTSVKK
jgi:hypothetical protein